VFFPSINTTIIVVYLIRNERVSENTWLGEGLGIVSYVAPATARSTVLAFVNRHTQRTKITVAPTMTTSLAAMLSIKLHITTGANRRNAIRGLRIALATVTVEDRGKMCTRGSLDFGSEPCHFVSSMPIAGL
jgi:hypothetical protein